MPALPGQLCARAANYLSQAERMLYRADRGRIPAYLRVLHLQQKPSTSKVPTPDRV